MYTYLHKSHVVFPGDSNTFLVIVTQMEMAVEPCFDGWICVA